jgi:hypothetical protein
VHTMKMRVGERLDFGLNFRRELLFGDTLADVVWSVTPTATIEDQSINSAAVTINSESIPAGCLASVFVGDVAIGQYALTATATTAQSRTFVRSMLIDVSS